MALGDGTHKLPVAAAVRRAINETDGDEVTVHLTDPLELSGVRRTSAGAASAQERAASRSATTPVERSKATPSVGPSRLR
jgi:hypothetical protein